MSTELTTDFKPTAIANPDDLINALSAEIAENVKPRGQNISVTRGGMFNLPNGEEADYVDLVVLAYAYHNTYYDKPWNPKSFAAPVCWARGPKQNDELSPSNDVSTPQSAHCRDCAKNQYGSALQGSGKACQNQIVLAVMNPDLAQAQDIYTIKVSATAIKAAEQYLARSAARFKHPIKVVTRFSVDMSRDWPRVVMEPLAPNTDYAEHLAYLEEARQLVGALGQEQGPATKTEDEDFDHGREAIEGRLQ